MPHFYKAAAWMLVGLATWLGVMTSSLANSPPARVADPAVWGVYAYLMDTSWKGPTTKRAIRWGAEGELIEDDSGSGAAVITQGMTPGTLVRRLGKVGLNTSYGTLAGDGSVVWIRKGFFKSTTRVSLKDGALIEEEVELVGTEVLTVKDILRFSQVAGKPVANQQAAAPAQQVAQLAQAPVVPEPVRIFGPMAALDGQQFAGDTSSIKFYLADGGKTLVIDLGIGWTYVLRGTAKPGALEVAAHPNTQHEYHEEDSFVAKVREDGAIAIKYDTDGVYGSSAITTVYKMQGNVLVEERHNHNWGMQRLLGSKQFMPATPELLQAATARAIQSHYARVASEREEKIAERQEKAEGQQRVYNYLQSELKTATVRQQQSSAQLDATLGQMRARTEPARQPAGASVPQQRPAEQTASPVKVQRLAAGATESTGPAAASAPGAQLRFILQIPLRAVINKVNATCYSNIVTIPGPAGWPDPSRQAGGDMPARALIERYMAGFMEQCKAFGPLASSTPNFHWNRKGSEHISPESVEQTGQRHRQPVVQL